MSYKSSVFYMKKLFAVITIVSMLPVGMFAQVTPAPMSPPIYPDGEESGDIVQLNNLRISAISSPTKPSIITASYDLAARCQKYATLESNTATTIACPTQASFSINVDIDTILLLRTRVRTQLNTFAVGDRVNVYGFMDRGTQTVDALIVRDLDKPVVKQVIQLNDMQVVSVSSQTAPATLTVISTPVSPCLDYTAGAKGLPYPCPLGVGMGVRAYGSSGVSDVIIQPQASVAYPGTVVAPMPSRPAIMPLQRQYMVEVTANTVLYDRNRGLIRLAAVEVGDRINAYGTLRNDSATLDAQIVRDLSKPVSDTAASLRVYVTSTDAPCLASSGGMATGDGTPPPSMTTNVLLPFPCRPLYNATVQLYGPNGTILKQMTERGVAFFERLPVGMYTAAVTADGYQAMKQEVYVAAGAANTATITLTPASTNPGQGPTVTGVSGSTSLAVGEMGTWTVKAFAPNNGTLWYEVNWGDENVPPPMPYASGTMPVRDTFQQTSTFSHAYQRAGVYQPTFVVKSGNGQMVKTSTSVRVGDGNTGGGTISSLNIEPESMTLKIGDTQQLHAYLYIQPVCPPGNFCAQMIRREEVFPKWSSSNPGVADVVTAQPMCITTPCNPITTVGAKSFGDAVLNASYTDASGKTYTGYAKVFVGGIVNNVGRLNIEPQSLQLAVGQTQTLNARFDNCPINAVCIMGPRLVDAEWMSSDSSIASVTKVYPPCPPPVYGGAAVDCRPIIQVTANGVGSATITAKYLDGADASYTAYAKVGVYGSTGTGWTMPAPVMRPGGNIASPSTNSTFTGPLPPPPPSM
jgi:hypothetical protein